MLDSVAQSHDFTCGAACFESMFRYFRGRSPGELQFAKELGCFELGHTPPKNIVALASKYGFECALKENATLLDLKTALPTGEVGDTVIFVTWWDEDAGHYSLIKRLNDDSITLMDPWAAREGRDTTLALSTFVPLWRQRGAIMIKVPGPVPSHAAK